MSWTDDRRWLESAARFARARHGSLGALVIDEAGPAVLGRGTSIESALSDAGDGALGATLFATVEPRDPEAIGKAGITRVVAGLGDPAGQGAFERLRAEGLAVDIVESSVCRELHSGRTTVATQSRPWLSLSLILSRDGMVADKDGAVPALGEPARRWLAFERSQAGAVLTGARRCDSFRLKGLDQLPRTRIEVVGSREPPLLPSPYTVLVVASGHDIPVPAAGDVVAVEGPRGRPNLRLAMSALARRGFEVVHAEVGARLTEALLAAGLVDRVNLLQSPRDIGRGGIPATALGGIEGRLRAAGLEEITERLLGEDRLRVYQRRA